MDPSILVIIVIVIGTDELAELEVDRAAVVAVIVEVAVVTTVTAVLSVAMVLVAAAVVAFLEALVAALEVLVAAEIHAVGAVASAAATAASGEGVAGPRKRAGGDCESSDRSGEDGFHGHVRLRCVSGWRS
jgi:hypothetical protein